MQFEPSSRGLNPPKRLILAKLPHSLSLFEQDLNDEDYGNHSKFCVLFPTLLILSESSVVGRTHAFMRPIEKVARLPTAADGRTSSLLSRR